MWAMVILRIPSEELCGQNCPSEDAGWHSSPNSYSPVEGDPGCVKSPHLPDASAGEQRYLCNFGEDPEAETWNNSLACS